MHSEPDLVTDPALAGVLAELAVLEPLFHRPGRAVSRAEFDRMTADDFWEIGASGNRYSRECCWAIVAERQERGEPDQVGAPYGFHCRQAGADTYLLTYSVAQPGRLTRRLTVWQRGPRGWVALFHQGTAVWVQAATGAADGSTSARQ